jgi:hypothetical protein
MHNAWFFDVESGGAYSSHSAKWLKHTLVVERTGFVARPYTVDCILEPRNIFLILSSEYYGRKNTEEKE